MSMQGVTAKSLTQYGLIALPMAFAGFPLYVLAPDYYATHHGISLTLLGSLLLMIRLLDAIQDPFIGWLTDRLQGRFLPYIYAAGAVLCLSILGLFNSTPIHPALWFTLCMFLAVSAYSVMSIMLGAWATLWTQNSHDQTRVAATRETFGLIGLIIAVSMPTALTYLVDPDMVYYLYTAILALLMLIGFVSISGFKTPDSARVLPENNTNLSFLSAWKALPKESLRLFTVHGLSMLASSIPAVLVVFFVRDLLDAEHLTGLFLLLYFLSGAAGIPLWGAISARLGKHQAWALSNIVAVAGFIGAFFLNSGDVSLYAAVCVVSGLALGADLTLPPSILADQIHARGSSPYAGTHYAFLVFVAKASLALASAVALSALDAAGFVPQIDNSAIALATLSATYALIPCALKLMAAGILYLYFISPNPGENHDDPQDHRNNRSFNHA